MGRDLGHTEASLDHAVSQVAQDLIGTEQLISEQQLVEGTGLPAGDVRRIWQALGFSQSRDRSATFTMADGQAFEHIAQMWKDPEFLSEDVLNILRALGRSTDRMASWQAHALSDAMHRAAHLPAPDDLIPAPFPTQQEALDPEVVQALIERVTSYSESIEQLIVYAWRHHMASSLTRLLADSTSQEAQTGSQRAVGFADLVSFTELTNGITERGLAHLVSRFERLCGEVIADHHGRLVKTVGDEVLFTAREPQQGLGIALDLVTALDADELLPPVRVGVAFGWVLLRLGDVFGPTVNRAHRLTDTATPGSVVLDAAMAAPAAGRADLVVVRQPTRELRGIGPTQSWLVARDAASVAAGGGVA